MNIKNHDFYQIYLCYLDSKNLSMGARALSEISESKFIQFLKRYESEPGFSEKWNKNFLSTKREENIELILENDDFDFFPDLKENKISFVEDDFEILFEDNSIKTIKNEENIDKNIFDF